MPRVEPLDLELEIYNMVIVRRDAVSGLYSVMFPSNRDIQQLYSTLGVRTPVPESTDEVMVQVRARVQKNWEQLKEFAATQSSYGRNSIMTKTPTVRVANNDNSKQDEARVRGMDTATVRKYCDQLNIAVTPHPTNPGITAMRAKNALAAKVRQGLKLPAAA